MQIFQTYCHNSCKDVLCRDKNQDASKQSIHSQMNIIIPCCYCVYLQNLSGLWIHISFQFSNWKESILSYYLRYSIIVLTLPFKLTFKCMSRPVSFHHLFEREEKTEIFKLGIFKSHKKRKNHPLIRDSLRVCSYHGKSLPVAARRGLST